MKTTEKKNTTDGATEGTKPTVEKRERPHVVEIIKIIIPVATFVLGSLLTLMFQSYQNRNKEIENSVHQVATLTKDWYSQLQNVFHYKKIQNPPVSLDPAVYDYPHNRLILTDLLFHLEILRKYPKCRELVLAVEDFLNIVTKQSTSNVTQVEFYCRDASELLQMARAWPATASQSYTGLPASITPPPQMAPSLIRPTASVVILAPANDGAGGREVLPVDVIEGEESLMQRLDSCIQRISTTAAHVL